MSRETIKDFYPPGERPPIRSNLDFIPDRSDERYIWCDGEHCGAFFPKTEAGQAELAAHRSELGHEPKVEARRGKR